MMPSIKYSIDTPHSVKDIANTFKKSLKVKIKLTWGIKLENAEKKKKPSDIDLVFFPVVSRTGTDIDAALSKITHSKPVIIVVLHHTFDPNAVVSNSSTFVKRDNTLTVDCLFYEDKGLLKCKRNDKAFEDAIQWLKLMKKVVNKKNPLPNPDKLPVQILLRCTGKRNVRVRALCFSLSPPEVTIALPPGLHFPDSTHLSLFTPSAVPHCHRLYILLSLITLHG
ncbi:uncharacterized protein [Sinocyclocheilus grahami]|uniref:uncharacterized protein isoform X1 n=1 Tax=Sinocyclocheilus grahami TaxID=75366 RepID=UPI0007ACF30F|nr:PREDICTED: uncharacterized protein LOC107596116 isoform X1 [Sinocyclocheilus grahami]